jgi:hypothetical protein
MEKIDIKFPGTKPNNPAEAEPRQVGIQNSKEYLSYLYENYADKVLGFIIQHNYTQKAAEKILIKVFVLIFEDINDYKQSDRPLLQMIGVAAKLIGNKKSVSYQHIK